MATIDSIFCGTAQMDSNPEILHDFFPLIRVYKDGRIERLMSHDIVPASVDPSTGVQCKDVNIVPENGVSARIYVPKSTDWNKKLPVLIYFHGGGFAVESALSHFYHTHLNPLVAESNVIAVSVNYRLTPEHPLPAAYEDSWDALKWVGSHSLGNGPEPWLRDYADFKHVFLAGDSAGANISHHMAMRFGSEKLDGVNLEGIILVHPWFWGKHPVGDEGIVVKSREYLNKIWYFQNPGTSGLDDPLINPAMDPRLSSLGCKKVLAIVSEKDALKDRGWYYKELLDKSAWGGKVEVVEIKGEGHAFHLLHPDSDKAVVLIKNIASFIN